MFETSAEKTTSATRALALGGRDERLRQALFDALREAELRSEQPGLFRDEVRWPLILALLDEVEGHKVILRDGSVVEAAPVSRIEQSLLLSTQRRPDHVWEPQTTKLLTLLAGEATDVIVGGAYIGDQVLPLARVLARRPTPGLVHAFEPSAGAFDRLMRNLRLNGLDNVRAWRHGLWDYSAQALQVVGPPALGESRPAGEEANSEASAPSITVDDYVQAQRVNTVGLVMLDIEGGEERALRGAAGLLRLPSEKAPHLVFEVHRNYVDWKDGLARTSILEFLTALKYTSYAIRDIQGNYPMARQPIEIIPIDDVYLEGPPHGFNLLATKDAGLVSRLDLRLVKNVSPKLIPGKCPRLHAPAGGFNAGEDPTAEAD